jgi:hypothetical protein
VIEITMQEHAEVNYSLLDLCEELKKYKISLNLQRMLFVWLRNVARPPSRLYDRLYRHIRCDCQTLLEEFSLHQIRHQV